MVAGLVVQVVGFKNSGKTSLIEGIIRELKTLGIEPKVIKTTHHLLEETDAGDTRRFLIAGARETVLLTPNGIRYQSSIPRKLEEVVEELDGLVIVEGGREVKRREWVGVIVIRREGELRALMRPRTIAIVKSGRDFSREARHLARTIAAMYKAQLSHAAFTAQHSANSS
ncbi:hypothetical protein EYM_05630 [Ignicoccus islandicus DSM 13165]|uniref:Molybdopterin-guanine dinucleotide biosynthesis protein B (MobB) domain-containing protein n=1 Tax=Ignicoccus islandicus DSM 13165 TaxID=940295 RepID=A0A0U3G2R7_9CREN|nr:molybdopterin-guanine dinucleotide biosynthesis protein MobB [Ignicoccus islandicus]ALU12604.1 hypothetical protein EYM_05630 [Ignicoccus islandicus DSM 13165]